MTQSEKELKKQIRVLDKQFAEALQDEAVIIKKQLCILWNELLRVRKSDAAAINNCN